MYDRYLRGLSRKKSYYKASFKAFGGLSRREETKKRKTDKNRRPHHLLKKKISQFLKKRICLSPMTLKK